jgi:hypothetical protein
MSTNKIQTALLLAAILALGACASTNETKPSARWTVASEQEVAAKLDEKLFEAAKGLVWLKKDDELLFCKRSRDIGSAIPTIKCINEAQLRTRVENMTKYRDDMRNRGGKCTLGRAGGPPCGAN